MAEVAPNAPKRPREIDIFNHHTNNNKLKTLAIALGIALVIITISYFLIKIFGTYTITIIADGGTVYGQELGPMEYRFLQKTYVPEGFKKEGYYIAGFYSDKDFKNEFTFGKKIWRSATVYVDWQPGYALHLFFAEGQGDDDRPEADNTGLNEEYLKTYYEQYVEPNTEWTLPEVVNTTDNARHKGEKLFWFDKDGNPVDNDTFVVSENIPFYGKWFDVNEDKFEITSEGTLTRYLGNCDNVVIPNSVKNFKDIDDESKFSGKYWDKTTMADGTYFSVFDRVINTLETVYIGDNCEELNSCLFKSCVSLKNVVFSGNKVTRIGNAVFAGCESLQNIIIPTSVTGIGNNAFANCVALETIEGTDRVRAIGEGAFSTCEKLTSLKFDSVRTVGRFAFGACGRLESLTFGYLDAVVSTTVNNPTETLDQGGDNILLGATIAKIYVPASLLSAYKADSVLGVYSGRIFAIA